MAVAGAGEAAALDVAGSAGVGVAPPDLAASSLSFLSLRSQ